MLWPNTATDLSQVELNQLQCATDFYHIILN